MSIVELQGLSKSYLMGEVEVTALRAVTFTINEGEFASITGPSGSGKSTLLNLLGCLDTPSGGEYVLAGERVSSFDDDRLSEVRRERIGFIFQSFNLIPQLTVLENIALPLIYADVSASGCRRRGRELAEKVGLTHRLHHRPVELSGGERQRVAIARALANDPVIVLADEPTGNLDTHTGQEIMDLLRELWRGGATLLLVTHDKALAEEAPRRISLTDGALVGDTYREPA